MTVIEQYERVVPVIEYVGERIGRFSKSGEESK